MSMIRRVFIIRSTGPSRVNCLRCDAIGRWGAPVVSGKCVLDDKYSLAASRICLDSGSCRKTCPSSIVKSNIAQSPESGRDCDSIGYEPNSG